MTRGAAGVAMLVLVTAAMPAGAQASFAGRNGRIAYSSFATDGEPRAIHTMDASGEDDRQLTRRGSARNPAWSRTGRLIAFDRGPADGDGPARLYVMRANGRDERRVPTGQLDARNPSWSPGGRRLVFQGCARGTDCQQDSIFLVRRDGGGLHQLATEGSDPVWAPNGRWIAYAGRLREGGCVTIIVVRPSGSDSHAVVRDDPDENGFCGGASGIDFAPDSQKLVYLALRARRSGSFPDPTGAQTGPVYAYDHAMYTVGLEGGEPQLVKSRSIESGYLLAPFAWSPDGARLLWRDDRGTFIGRPSGGGEQRITGARGGGGDYAWQSRVKR